MPLTLEQARILVIGPLRAAMSQAGLLTLTDPEMENADVDAAIAAAAIVTGVTVADPTAPTSDELANLAADRVREFIDRGVLELLLYVRGNWVNVSYSLDGRSESLSDLLAGLDRLITDRRAAIRLDYASSSLAVPVPGRIRGGGRYRNRTFV